MTKPEPQLVAQTKISTEMVRKLTGLTEEKEKYMRCWNVDQYRDHSPGEQEVDRFLDAIDVEAGDTLVDWGCGTGRAGLALWRAGFDTTLVDFAFNSLDENVAALANDESVEGIKFLEHDITEKIELRSDFGFCTDVLEHIPPEQIDRTLDVILENSRNVYFQISTLPDHFGLHPEIDAPLHLSVHPYQWWLKKFVECGCIIHRSLELPGRVVFFVSGYTGFSFDKLQHNTAPDQIHEHMRGVAELGYQNLHPKEANDMKLVVLAGGPSLNDYIDEITRKRNEEGYKLVTVNGTYKWALDHGLTPSLHMMLDARPFNARFVDPVVEGCKYVIGTQCHPSVFEGLPKEDTYLWQVTLDEATVDVVKELWGTMYEDWFPCTGGSTVMMRALPTLQMLGFKTADVYGFDSCNREASHHAYEQRENDKASDNQTIPMLVNGKTFQCQPWMIAQAKEFVESRHNLLRELDITVHGDGLIAYLLETGADITEE